MIQTERLVRNCTKLFIEQSIACDCICSIIKKKKEKTKLEHTHAAHTLIHWKTSQLVKIIMKSLERLLFLIFYRPMTPTTINHHRITLTGHSFIAHV